MPAGLQTLSISAGALIAFACGSTTGSEVFEVMAGPEMIECVGVGLKQRMVVDGALFYSRIDGFGYEEGNVYKLKMERYDAWPK